MIHQFSLVKNKKILNYASLTLVAILMMGPVFKYKNAVLLHIAVPIYLILLTVSFESFQLFFQTLKKSLSERESGSSDGKRER